MAEVAALLLAAGTSRRMGGRNKLLLDVRGAPMVRRVAEALIASRVDRTVAVLGHEADRVAAALDGLDLETVLNARYAEGRESSLLAGLAALDEPLGAVVVCPADQPLLTPEDVDPLIAACLDAAKPVIVVPVFEGRRGRPLALSGSFRAELVALHASGGARGLMERFPEAILEVAAASDHCLRDIDTADAYAALTESGDG